MTMKAGMELATVSAPRQREITAECMMTAGRREKMTKHTITIKKITGITRAGRMTGDNHDPDNCHSGSYDYVSCLTAYIKIFYGY